MRRFIAYGLLVVFAAASCGVVWLRPAWVSDNNTFLDGFIGQELLNLLGVILAITLASVANIHLEFNKIEERYRRRGLTKSRSNLRWNATFLIALFVAALVLVTVKPILAANPTSEGLINMGCMLLLLWHILILVDLTDLVFAMEPHITDD